MTNRNVTDSSQEGGKHHTPPGPPDHLLSHGGNKEGGDHHPLPGPPDHLLSHGGNKGNHHPPSGPPDHLLSRSNNKVFKSGPLFLSSKGIGWTSWKKRWFILTRTSLVFFRSDPNAVNQKGNEVNLTLGGIDLNNSGRVDVKADKKLLTVLFPDGRDGRAFTLKAETSEDLHEWKVALEEALAQAPSATLVMGQNGIFRNGQTDAFDGPADQSKEKQPVKSLVIGRPILLALEDIDGNPSFLEKALRFVEEHGVKVEGILRQAADVDDVEHRIREYEQGKIDFSPEEDAHVIADCVKYVLRELPSSPVPASCCKALLEACRTEHGRRLVAMREAICETFPEPNRRLLQRILLMMQTIASNKAENRMSCSAVAACMAPLLLRPLLAGDCDLEHDFDVGGDGSIQLLQAAAAANHAQAIVVTLLEEYENIFGEGSMSTELYSDSEESGSQSEELSDYDDETTEDGTYGSHADIDEELEDASNETHSETGSIGYDDKGPESHSFGSDSKESYYDHNATQIQSQSCQHGNVPSSENIPNQTNSASSMKSDESAEALGNDPAETVLVPNSTDKNFTSSNGPVPGARRAAVWGRTPAKKKLSMEYIDFPFEDEAEIERLEVTKIDLQKRVAEEAKENTVLQESLERRKNALHEQRLALEQEVARLQGQLNKEKELRKVLEAGLQMPQGSLLLYGSVDEKTKAELEDIVRVEADVINLKKTADDLGMQLNQQRELNSGFAHGPCSQARLRERGNEIEAPATLYAAEKLTRSKDNQLDKVDGDKDLKHDLPFYSNKQLAQKQMMDPARNSKSTSSSANSKKSGARDEGASNSTSSALSKLTNRLNFLKERRGQIANELQNMDKGRGSGSSVQSFERGSGLEGRHSVENPDKFYGTIDNQSVYNSQKGLKMRSSHSPLTSENTERLRITEGGSLQHLDKGKMEAQFAPNLERGKSESFPNAEKGRRSEGHPHVPPRTYSR